MVEQPTLPPNLIGQGIRIARGVSAPICGWTVRPDNFAKLGSFSCQTWGDSPRTGTIVSTGKGRHAQ